MGYRRPKATFTLSFEDETMDGLEVRCQSVSFETWLHVAELTGDGVALIPANKDTLLAVLEEFCRTVIEWNLEDDDGKPIPCTPTAITTMDRAFIRLLIDAWITGLVEVPGPLPKPSAASVTSLAESLPMEPLSESQAS